MQPNNTASYTIVGEASVFKVDKLLANIEHYASNIGLATKTVVTRVGIFQRRYTITLIGDLSIVSRLTPELDKEGMSPFNFGISHNSSEILH